MGGIVGLDWHTWQLCAVFDSLALAIVEAAVVLLAQHATDVGNQEDPKANNKEEDDSTIGLEKTWLTISVILSELSPTGLHLILL